MRRKTLRHGKVNERWRVAIAGLVAVLAIPILVIDSPSTAEGVVDAGLIAAAPASIGQESALVDDVADVATPIRPSVVTIERIVRPDAAVLGRRAASWGTARAEAVKNGLVDATVINSSATNLSLLPEVPKPPPVEEPPPDEDPTPDKPPVAPLEPDPAEPDPPIEPVEPDPPVPTTTTVPDEAAEKPEPDSDPALPPTPAQVNGRFPPPAGGPSAAQWDALRRCESTHDYAAISSSGLYRGAYQFSQQTWDWVAGIHYPYLVGIDPAVAQPGWQDVMAYTLYAMRGWDQWPICGKHLL